MATMVRESAIMPGWATMRELAKIAQTSDGAMRIWIMRHPECERRLVRKTAGLSGMMYSGRTTQKRLRS